MAKKNWGEILGMGMMAFGKPDLYKDYMRRKEEEENRKAIAAKIEAMRQGGGGLFPTGMSSEGKMSYGMLSPEEQRTEEFQKNIGAVTQAERLLKGRPTPATLQAMPRLEGLAGKERAKGILRSRLPQENVLRRGRATLRAHPDIKGAEWQKGAKGTFERVKTEDATKKRVIDMAIKLTGDKDILTADELKEAIFENIALAEQLLGIEPGTVKTPKGKNDKWWLKNK